MATTHHLLVVGDARQMSELRDESVHLVVTSPPYWQLKDYGHPAQIGFEQSYEEYINSLNLVWSECYRVLHPGCRLCINIGDQFARSVYYGRYKVVPIHAEVIRFCEALGMDYLGAIIWQKVTTTNTSGGARVMGSFPYPRNGIVKLDYEFILLFKKLGTPPAVDPAIKQQAAFTTEEWNTYFAGHWTIPGARQLQHIAAFPPEIPRRLIRMFSFPGETVLDPFVGSGTTMAVARQIGRNSVGYEINAELVPVIEAQLEVHECSMFDTITYQRIERPVITQQWEDAYDRLPYRFEDPHQFNKRLDPRTRPFGSRIGWEDRAT